jgi:large subunit ribosomal protein L15
MQLDKLPKITKRSAKRVGRGIGSGKGGHTTGRGTKGQKARDKISPIFEGTKTKKSFIKRLPFLRGRGKLKHWNGKPEIVNLFSLADWPKGTPVSFENLVKRGVLKENPGKAVKILGKGEIKQALEIRVKTSKQAREKILKAGGKIIE